MLLCKSAFETSTQPNKHVVARRHFISTINITCQYKSVVLTQRFWAVSHQCRFFRLRVMDIGFETPLNLCKPVAQTRRLEIFYCFMLSCYLNIWASFRYASCNKINTLDYRQIWYTFASFDICLAVCAGFAIQGPVLHATIQPVLGRVTTTHSSSHQRVSA